MLVIVSPISWDCRIHQLLLCIGIYPPHNKCSGYDIKLSDGQAPALEIWELWSTPSLQLIPGPLSSGVVAFDSILSMDQIEQTVCKQITDVKL